MLHRFFFILLILSILLNSAFEFSFIFATHVLAFSL
jgi:hypothetical protein